MSPSERNRLKLNDTGFNTQNVKIFNKLNQNKDLEQNMDQMEIQEFKLDPIRKDPSHEK